MKLFKKLYGRKNADISAEALVIQQENIKKQEQAEQENAARAWFLQHTENYLNKVRNVPVPNLDFPVGRPVHFKHSGNSGDIIYAIPTMRAIAQHQPICLHLYLNRPADYAKHIKHPLGNVTFTQKTFEMLYPLLISQPQFQDCKVLEDDSTPIDVDLDIMRDYPMLLDRGNIARWYFLVFPVNFNLNLPWLKVTPDTDMKDSIVLARSNRYQAPNIDYSILKQYPSVYFVGMPEEYAEMKKIIPTLNYRPVKNFLEMASVIAGSRLFIGNQSFPFSVAEALKANRLLEVYFDCPNVTVYGDNGFDFSFQPQFEKLIRLRYEAT
ncbi:MAG: hypothetical protein QM768_09040 [Agriterribacter sp.]